MDENIKIYGYELKRETMKVTELKSKKQTDLHVCLLAIVTLIYLYDICTIIFHVCIAIFAVFS
jgi:hypothetical protein